MMSSEVIKKVFGTATAPRRRRRSSSSTRRRRLRGGWSSSASSSSSLKNTTEDFDNNDFNDDDDNDEETRERLKSALFDVFGTKTNDDEADGNRRVGRRLDRSKLESIVSRLEATMGRREHDRDDRFALREMETVVHV